MGRFVVFLIIFIVVVFAYPYLTLMFTYWVFHSCTRSKDAEILGVKIVCLFLIRESRLNSIIVFLLSGNCQFLVHLPPGVMGWCMIMIFSGHTNCFSLSVLL